MIMFLQKNEAEFLSCSNCRTFHTIRKGTLLVCHCGEIVRSSCFSSDCMQSYLDEAGYASFDWSSLLRGETNE